MAVQALARAGGGVLRAAPGDDGALTTPRLVLPAGCACAWVCRPGGLRYFLLLQQGRQQQGRQQQGRVQQGRPPGEGEVGDEGEKMEEVEGKEKVVEGKADVTGSCGHEK